MVPEQSPFHSGRRESTPASASRRHLRACQHPCPTRATFGAKTGTTFDFARFLVILAAAHLFLDTAPFHQLPKTPHGLLDRLVFTQRQFDHSVLLLASCRQTKARPSRTNGYTIPLYRVKALTLHSLRAVCLAVWYHHRTILHASRPYLPATPRFARLARPARSPSKIPLRLNPPNRFGRFASWEPTARAHQHGTRQWMNPPGNSRPYSISTPDTMTCSSASTSWTIAYPRCSPNASKSEIRKPAPPVPPLL